MLFVRLSCSVLVPGFAASSAITTEATIDITTLATNFSFDVNSTELEDIEGRALTSVGSGASQGCRSFQGGVGRCVPYSECSAAFENEFIARSSLCGFSNRRPLVCCPHDTFSGYGHQGFQPIFPGFQQNFFQQNPFANSFFYNPAQSFYSRPTYNNPGYGFQQQPFGYNNQNHRNNNNGFGGGGGFGNYGNNGYTFRPGYRQPAYIPSYPGGPVFSAHNPFSNNNRFQNGYAGGYPPSGYVQPTPTSPPTYVGTLPGQNTNHFGLPNLRPPFNDLSGGGGNQNNFGNNGGGSGSGVSVNNDRNDGDTLLNSRCKSCHESPCPVVFPHAVCVVRVLLNTLEMNAPPSCRVCLRCMLHSQRGSQSASRSQRYLGNPRKDT